MRGRSDLKHCRLRTGRLGKLGRCQGDDRHRPDGDPGNWDARHSLPGETTSRTSGSYCADDRVDIAQLPYRIVNRRVLGHTGLLVVSHAVLEMLLKLPDEAAALQPPATDRLGQSGQELGSGIPANLQPPQARVRIQSRSRDSGAASYQAARGVRSGCSVTRHTRVCADH